MDYENMRMFAAGLSASLIGPIEEWLSSRLTSTTRPFCTHCKAVVETEEEAIAHDSSCLKHPMAQRALKAEARIAELTADEKPRKAAERIVDQVFFAEPPRATITRLIDAITTAIQAASNAQLERGRAKIAELREELQKVTKHWRGSLDERIALDHWNHVYDFMQKFGQHIGDTPGWPPQEVLESKLRRVTEEFCELIAACGYKVCVQVGRRDGVVVIEEGITRDVATEPDLPHAVREAVDLEFSTHHLMISCGVDTAEPWARVHAANMAKELRDGRPVKPDGWQAPDIAGALREQGWQGGAE